MSQVPPDLPLFHLWNPLHLQSPGSLSASSSHKPPRTRRGKLFFHFFHLPNSSLWLHFNIEHGVFSPEYERIPYYLCTHLKGKPVEESPK